MLYMRLDYRRTKVYSPPIDYLFSGRWEWIGCTYSVIHRNGML